LTLSKSAQKQDATFTRQFSVEDQVQFAALSGDQNPMHLSETDARRLMFGERVVHGVHGVLWALQEFSAWRGVSNLHHLKASFLNPIHLYKDVEAQVTVTDGKASIKLIGETGTAFKIKFEFEPDAAAGTWDGPNEISDSNCEILEEQFFERLSGELKLAIPLEHLKRCLPGLYANFDRFQLAVILATTRLVGMKCPGLHSLYVNLDLNFSTVGAENFPLPASPPLSILTFDAVRFDPRFPFVDLNVEANDGMQHAAGSIRSAFRPPPVHQASYKECANAIAPGTFVGQSALIIGGSRGLGEIATKLLAGGGANVIFTYFSGAREADEIANTIRAGGGMAKSIAFNILDCGTLDRAALGCSDVEITHLYYFPSPKIKPNGGKIFNNDLYAEFRRFYVDGLQSVLEILIPNQNTGIDVFYPSSEFLDTPQPGFREYETAKSDGEKLCAELGMRFSGKAQFHHPRIPRVKTDQTASLLPIDAQDPLPIMVSLLTSIAQKQI
jgi:acyl dehydratase